MNFKLRQLLTGLAALILFLAIMLILIPVLAFERPQTINGTLESLITKGVDGWDVRKLDVADSAEMRDQVFRVLRFDDVVYLGYRHEEIEVQLNVAYWKPGTVPYGQVGVHTPDTCWVNAGWTREKRAHGQSLVIGDKKTKPAETGQYSMRGQTLHVAFWHLVGGRAHSYEQFGWSDGISGVKQRLPNLFTDLRRYGFNLAQE
jgi:hypothetical protein